MDQDITSSTRLDLLHAPPGPEHLFNLYAKAHDQPGTVVRIPWVDEETKTPYTLSLCFAVGPKAGDPEWTLKRGLGTHATTLFVHRTGDVGLIHGLLPSQSSSMPSRLDGNSVPMQAPSRQLGKSETAKKAGDVTARILQETSGVYKQLNSRRIEDAKAPPPVVDAKTRNRHSQQQQQPKNNLLIGDLLLQSGYVTEDQLNQAVPMAMRTGFPVGRILEESGLISPSIVQAAVLAQSLIQDKLLHLKLGMKALKLVGERDITLEEALKQLGWRSEYYEVANKLGQLLIDAGAMGEEQLKIAFEVCFATGLPLGRVLVLRKVVPEVVAYTALSAQVFLRDGKITRESALSAIRDAGSKKNTIQGSISASKTINPNVRLGELLVLAGIVSEVDLVSALETGMSLGSMIGQVLVMAGRISQPVLDNALKLQAEANAHKLTIAEAAEKLRRGDFEVQTVPPLAKGDETVQAAFKALEKVDGTELRGILEKLLTERENLAFRLVSEHEEIKNRLARELHDTIIADLMMLKRYLSGDKQLTVPETIAIVDDVVKQLRDICNDFVPKHLQEWGLKTTLQDLVERVSLRTGMTCDFECEPDLKNLPEAVHLHIFRIIQECFNNIEKYAKASRVVLRVEYNKQGHLKFTVQDNGQGFEADVPRTAALTTEGGRGLHGMQERVHLIRCYLPTTLEVSSIPGQGSTVTMVIKPVN